MHYKTCICKVPFFTVKSKYNCANFRSELLWGTKCTEMKRLTFSEAAQSLEAVLASPVEERGWEADAEEVRAHRQVSPLKTSKISLRRLHVQSEDERDAWGGKSFGKAFAIFKRNYSKLYRQFFVCEIANLIEM